MQPFVLHAHFYQPERTNPWTDILDPEPSAAPYRDWNARIHAESYRPNAAARIFDDQRRVERIVNNYERLSFNFGPTLLRWMERRQPETYGRILDGDWRSVARTGHGNALAQAYNHVILPLANERDRATQVRWGLADFRHRFRREAEGMWLPETAANQASLDLLIDEGVRFTVLAPHQAHRVRHRNGRWHDVSAGVDTTRAYEVRHSDGSGRALVVFFYEGVLAQWLAFAKEASAADAIVQRLAGVAPGGGLAHAALDGETFGHHRKFGELALAYTLFEGAERHGLTPTSYGAWLAENPPTEEAQIVPGEGTAWSCAHGVGRWYRDCGCATDSQPGWNQAWRTPLREALERVDALAAETFERVGGELLRDPWRARDDYVHLLLRDWTPQQFLDRHAARQLTAAQQCDVWSLLESQRHGMAMYTSCGWFFGDIAGIESAYVLRFAARTLGLLEDVGTDTQATRQDMLDLLAQAESNLPDGGTGADVWRDQVLPDVVSPMRIGAQLCLLALTQYEQAENTTAGATLTVAGHALTVHERRVEQRGRLALVTGRASVRAHATGRTHDLAAAAIHLGGLDFHGLVAPDPGPDKFAAATVDLWEGFATAPLAHLIRLLDRVFTGNGATEFGFEWALPWAKQDLVEWIFSDLSERFADAYARLYHENRRILESLVAGGHHLPRMLRAAAELTLTVELEDKVREISAAGSSPPDAVFEAIHEIVALARSQQYLLDLGPVRAALEDAVTAATRQAVRRLDQPAVDIVVAWIELARALELSLDLSAAQEVAWDTLNKARASRVGMADREAVAALGEAIGFAPVAWSAERASR